MKILAAFLSDTPYSMSIQEERNMIAKAKKHTISKDGHAYCMVGNDQRMVKVPFIQERESILKEVHDGHGHAGQHSKWSIMFRNY